ncbi:hypothetical protein M231_01204 [Tremella mesenterica]|uniref:Uncharacterized protein n=1 Tax=Tremella mesenterica TaxID=5217 RepID=A0A4Q1BTY5_TREME|nr:hypothetical protein M231_01204 [Tremella mesenterica]
MPKKRGNGRPQVPSLLDGVGAVSFFIIPDPFRLDPSSTQEDRQTVEVEARGGLTSDKLVDDLDFYFEGEELSFPRLDLEHDVRQLVKGEHWIVSSTAPIVWLERDDDGLPMFDIPGSDKWTKVGKLFELPDTVVAQVFDKGLDGMLSKFHTSVWSYYQHEEEFQPVPLNEECKHDLIRILRSIEIVLSRAATLTCSEDRDMAMQAREGWERWKDELEARAAGHGIFGETGKPYMELVQKTLCSVTEYEESFRVWSTESAPKNAKTTNTPNEGETKNARRREKDTALSTCCRTLGKILGLFILPKSANGTSVYNVIQRLDSEARALSLIDVDPLPKLDQCTPAILGLYTQRIATAHTAQSAHKLPHNVPSVGDSVREDGGLGPSSLGGSAPSPSVDSVWSQKGDTHTVELLNSLGGTESQTSKVSSVLRSQRDPMHDHTDPTTRSLSPGKPSSSGPFENFQQDKAVSYRGGERATVSDSYLPEDIYTHAQSYC